MRAFSMTFDSKKQRKIMGQFATGVTVVTTGGNGGLHGLTANAVASLSLNPPLVLVAVEKSAHSFEFLKKNRCFAINILRLDQEHISRRFAKPGPKDFSGLNTTTASTAAPILPGCVAYVDCRVVDILPGGDHEIFVGEIVSGEYHGGEPLLYHAGGYHRLAHRADTHAGHKVALEAATSNTKATKSTKDPQNDQT
jgi:flavin reductase (DIM6/NTAB) family NADH-FMN oxidoreductase RutF